MVISEVGRDRQADSAALLEVRNLGVNFNENTVLNSVSLTVARSEFVCIVGPSGVGKTTLLRCLAGLRSPSAGSVWLNGVKVTQPPAGMSVVFQDYSRSLFPWMRVLDNVSLPLRKREIPKSRRLERARAALEEVGLRNSEHKYPWQLSGGMQQRVAIARALVNEPKVCLMDEPFASVDAQTRFELEDLTLKVGRDTGVSMVFVTHDVDEAVYLSNRVVVLSGIPASVTDCLDVNLGSNRDQLTTRADPLFAELRSAVLMRIRNASSKGHEAIPEPPLSPVTSLEI